MLRNLALALLLVTGHAQAQNPSQAELMFWETVRDSKNPAELRAYLQRFPNGMFAPIAEARLAALEKAAPAVPVARPAAPAAAPARPAPPAVASTAPSSVTAATRMPQAGDAWTYKLSYPRVRGQWGQRARHDAQYIVKVGSTGDGRIVDQLSVDGGSATETIHSGDAYVVSQGVSVFSPYLVAFRDLQAQTRFGSVAMLDPGCSGRYVCNGSARVAGQELIQLPTGSFKAIKVVVTHNWSSSGGGSGAAALAGMLGGRTVTVWYVPELKRAVKVQSRVVVGDTPPVESNFDLELVSYQVK
jgi:hypothetical protein